ncbi:MAG: hypothetical protein LWY06_05235 [Firmicutes bacterium]|nr:hypothetical protein [Bacillota bacterium]
MVSITRKAAEMIRVNKNSKKYLRVFSEEAHAENSNFQILYTDEVNKDDILYMSYGIKILVGGKTRKHFENLRIDYAGQNGGGHFVFDTRDPIPADM